MALLISVIAAYFVACLFMLSTCASSDHVNVQKSLAQVHMRAEFSTLPSLPRKLKLINHEEVKSFADKDFIPHKKLMEASAGNKQHEKEEKVMNVAGKGTMREWVDQQVPNKSEYFTMDYVWVKRRRPIHNKQIPMVP